MGSDGNLRHLSEPLYETYEQWKVVHKSVLVTLTIYSGGTPSNAAKRAASACNSASLAAMISSCASGCIAHAATSQT